MERRVLIALALSFLVLYVYQTYVVKPLPKPSQTTAAGGAATSSAAGTSATSATAEAAATSGSAAEAAPAVPAATPIVGETSEREVRVETKDVIAVFTNRGARLKSWRLKKYLDSERQPQELIENEIPTHPLPF